MRGGAARDANGGLFGVLYPCLVLLSSDCFCNAQDAVASAPTLNDDIQRDAPQNLFGLEARITAVEGLYVLTVEHTWSRRESPCISGFRLAHLSFPTPLFYRMFIATVLRSLKAHFTRRMDDGGGALLTLFYTEVRKMESVQCQIYFM